MKIRDVTLAAVLLSASQTAFAEDQVNYDGDGYVTPVAFVGDVSRDAEDAYFAADAAEATRAQQRRVATAAAVSQPTQYYAQPQTAYKPVAQVGCMGGCTGSGCGASNCDAPSCGLPGPAMSCDSIGCDSPSCGCDSVTYSGGCDSIGCGTIFGGGCDSPSCGDGCDSPSCGCEMGGGCDSFGGGCRGGGCGGGLAGALGLCSKDGWFRSEVLLWFLQDRNSPALISESGVAVPPLQENSITRFGGKINGGLSAGYRGDAGVYLSDNLGIGGRFWILGDNEEKFSRDRVGGGNSSLGRPFFDTNSGAEEAILVAFRTAPGNPDLFAGSVMGSSKLSMLGAEAYGRLNLGSTKTCQLDLIGGYSYFSVDDELRVFSSSTQNTGRTRTYNDEFDTENTMHGGQVGFETVVTNGRWFARSLTKVHMGDMNQKVSIRGNSTDSTPSGGTVAVSDGGLLALESQGTYERNEFAFVPELNFKLGYRFRQHVEMSVGYSFLMFDGLALSGDQIDRNIDESLRNTIVGPGTHTIKDTSLWVQGIDLGLAITF